VVRLVGAVLLVTAGALWAADAPKASSSAPGGTDSTGPVLYGDAGGRLWKWTGGEKTFLTPEGPHLSLGGVGETQLWGWSADNGQVKLFTLAVPKKDADPKAKEPAEPPPVPVFDTDSYPAPDRIDRRGDRTLLVYGALSGHPRVEVFQSGRPVSQQAWDDGRLVYAASLGPDGAWMAAGRRGASPWLELNGAEVPVPEGWRGRLTVTAWVSTEKDGPAVAQAAGWGAPGDEVPRALFWGPGGWTQSNPEGQTASEGVYPLLGAPGDAGLTLAGWKADAGTGTLRPWFWDGAAETVGKTAADGQPVAFGAEKKGAFLVVRHQSAPWFTLEDGTESVPLEGLASDDRVVAVEPDSRPSP